jgi:hypothetical protein
MDTNSFLVATVSLGQNQGLGGGITFDTGVQQGSVLYPTLFNIFLNPLLWLLTEIGKKQVITHYIRLHQGLLSSLIG